MVNRRGNRGGATSPGRLRLVTRADRVASDERAELMATVHEQIVPHLILVHGMPEEPQAAQATRLPTDAELSELVDLAVRQDFDAAVRFIAALMRDGMSAEGVLLALIAPAARRLGEDAEADRRSLAEAAEGMDTIQRIVGLLRSVW